MAAQAGRAVNISLTMRNWLIGAYIAEYELRGLDRASYGDGLLAEL
ncbi:MAG TPA: cytoplasmic protein, partial [Candidatus Acetothermia bacterium]|nr:cytoplasmic protein [Candidatus Acetothermia bacterium]